MAPVPRDPLLYVDAEGTKTIKQVIDMDPVFYTPWKDPETIDGYKFRIEEVIRENMRRYPFLRDSQAQVYIACKNLEGEQWAEMKRFVEPHILYHYPYTLHPLRFEDRGIIDFPYFISLMRYEKAKFMYKERREWYIYPIRPARPTAPVPTESQASNRSPRNSDGPKPKGQDPSQESSQYSDWSKEWELFNKKMEEGRKRRKERMEALNKPKRAKMEEENQEGYKVPENPTVSNPERGERKEGGNLESTPLREEEDDEDPEEEDPEEEDPEEGDDETEEEDVEKRGTSEENYEPSPINYTIDSSSSSSSSPSRRFIRQQAPEYATDSQNDLDDDDERYFQWFPSE